MEEFFRGTNRTTNQGGVDAGLTSICTAARGVTGLPVLPMEPCRGFAVMAHVGQSGKPSGLLIAAYCRRQHVDYS